MHTRVCSSLLLISVGVLGCGGTPASKAIVGTWELDRAATQEINPILATVPGGIGLELNGDKTFSDVIAGEHSQGNWAVTADEGGVLKVELIDSEGMVTKIDLQPTGRDRLILNFPEGLGKCVLKRVDKWSSEVAQTEPLKRDESSSKDTPAVQSGIITSEPEIPSNVQTVQPSKSIDIEDPTELDVAADGRTAIVLTMGKEDSVQVWDIANTKQLYSWDVQSGDGDGSAIVPDASCIYFCDYASSVYARELAEGAETQTLDLGEHYLGALSDIVLLADAQDLLMIGSSAAIRYDRAEGTAQLVFEAEDDGFGFDAASNVFDQENRIVMGCHGGVLKVYSLENGSELQSLSLENKEERFRALAVDSRGERLASYQDDAVAITNLKSGNTECEIPVGEYTQIYDMLFLPDDKTLVYPEDRDIILYDVEQRRQIARLQGHQLSAWQMKLSPDAKTLYSVGEDDTLRVWDLSTVIE